MTPKEKAKELVDRFYTNRSRDDLPLTMYWSSAIGCALIAVDEILKILPQSEYLEDRSEMVENRELIYWKEVKQEIEKL